MGLPNVTVTDLTQGQVETLIDALENLKRDVIEAGNPHASDEANYISDLIQHIEHEANRAWAQTMPCRYCGDPSAFGVCDDCEAKS